ncbi:MAG: hypothetical protein QME40_08150, partial [bacterium]|nr:hypothetical protein [bacterium]
YTGKEVELEYLSVFCGERRKTGKRYYKRREEILREIIVLHLRLLFIIWLLTYFYQSQGNPATHLLEAFFCIIGGLEKVTSSDNGEWREYRINRPIVIRIRKEDKLGQWIMGILLYLAKDPETGRRLIPTQKEIGHLIGISRQMFNEKWNRFKEGGKQFISLYKKYHTDKFTTEVRERIQGLLKQNIFLRPKEILNRLKEERL